MSAEIIYPAHENRYVIRPGETYLPEVPARENTRPNYPPALLAEQLDPVALVERVVVSGGGTVDRAEVIRTNAPYPAFADAVLSAVGGWSFSPLRRITGDQVEALPFAQAYKFTLKQVNGRAVVTQECVSLSRLGTWANATIRDIDNPGRQSGTTTIPHRP